MLSVLVSEPFIVKPFMWMSFSGPSEKLRKSDLPKFPVETGEMTQCVRTPAVLAEGLGLTPMGQLSTICNSGVGILHPLLASTGIAYTQYLDMHVHKHSSTQNPTQMHS